MEKVKTLLLTAALLSATGCMWQTVDNYGLNVASVMCKDRGGVDSVTGYATGSVAFTCGDGVYYDSYKVDKFLRKRSERFIKQHAVGL